MLTISDFTAPNIVVDSNVGSTGEGPDTFTIAAEVCNTGTDPVTDLFVFVGDGTTRGTFDSVSCPSGPFLSPQTSCSSGPGTYTGTFSLQMLGDDIDPATGLLSDASRYLGGELGVNECFFVHWQVSYPQTDAGGTPTWGRSNDITDDLIPITFNNSA